MRVCVRLSVCECVCLCVSLCEYERWQSCAAFMGRLRVCVPESVWDWVACSYLWPILLPSGLYVWLSVVAGHGRISFDLMQFSVH